MTNLDEWMETENQDQEMAFGYGSTKANPDQKKTQVKFKEIGLVLGNKKKMRVMRLMKIQELKWNVLCAKKSNVN